MSKSSSFSYWIRIFDYGFRISRPLKFEKRDQKVRIKMNTEERERYLRLRWAWRLMTWTSIRLWLRLAERRFSIAHFTAKLLFLSFSTATAVVITGSAIASSVGGCHIADPDNLAGLILGRWCAWWIPGICIPSLFSSPSFFFSIFLAANQLARKGENLHHETKLILLALLLIQKFV